MRICPLVLGLLIALLTTPYLAGLDSVTACKALYRCDSCQGTFDYFKCI